MAYQIIAVSEDPVKEMSDTIIVLKYQYGIMDFKESSLLKTIQNEKFHVVFLTPTEFMIRSADEKYINAIIFGVKNLDLIQMVNPNQTQIPDISVADFISCFEIYTGKGVEKLG